MLDLTLQVTVHLTANQPCARFLRHHLSSHKGGWKDVSHISAVAPDGQYLPVEESCVDIYFIAHAK